MSQKNNLRDHFAGLALGELIRAHENTEAPPELVDKALKAGSYHQLLADHAYQFADAMLKAREGYQSARDTANA